MRAAMAGVNAAVVGVLLAALYDPVWSSAIHSRIDFALALACFAMLVHARISPVLVVAFAAIVGSAVTL
jgi:chromate transporter